MSGASFTLGRGRRASGAKTRRGARRGLGVGPRAGSAGGKRATGARAGRPIAARSASASPGRPERDRARRGRSRRRWFRLFRRPIDRRGLAREPSRSREGGRARTRPLRPCVPCPCWRRSRPSARRAVREAPRGSRSFRRRRGDRARGVRSTAPKQSLSSVREDFLHDRDGAPSSTSATSSALERRREGEPRSCACARAPGTPSDACGAPRARLEYCRAAGVVPGRNPLLVYSPVGWVGRHCAQCASRCYTGANVWGAVRAIARVTDRRRFHRDERAWSRSLRGHLNLEIVARPGQSLDLRRSRKRAAGSGTRGREPSRLSTAWRRGTRVKGSSRLLPSSFFPSGHLGRADGPRTSPAPRASLVSARRRFSAPRCFRFGGAKPAPAAARGTPSALRHARSASRLLPPFPSPPRPSARSAPDTPRPRFLPSPWSSSSPDRTPRLRARARRGTPRPRTRTRRPRRTTPRPPRRLPPPRARRPPRRRRAPGSRSRSTASARSSPRGTRASPRGRRSPRRTREPRRRARRGSDAKRGRPAEKKFSSPRYAGARRRNVCFFVFLSPSRRAPPSSAERRRAPPSSAELRLALALALALAPALLPPPLPPLTSPARLSRRPART